MTEATLSNHSVHAPQPASKKMQRAFEMVELGFSVFPVHFPKRSTAGGLICSCSKPDCKSPAKHPLGSLAPKGVLNASRNLLDVSRWWNQQPHANIGIATGSFVVVDVDPRHNGDESLLRIERSYGKFPHTWRSITGGGGEHIFFVGPTAQGVKNSASSIAPGLDIRGEGGYVLGPGSIHISGRKYCWSVDHHPDETPIAQMPDWLLRAGSQQEKAPRPPEHWKTLASVGVREGGRNTALASLTGHLLRKNIEAGMVLDLMQAWNAMRCDPPLSRDEVTQVVDSIAKKDLARRRQFEAQRGLNHGAC